MIRRPNKVTPEALEMTLDSIHKTIGLILQDHVTEMSLHSTMRLAEALGKAGQSISVALQYCRSHAVTNLHGGEE